MTTQPNRETVRSETAQGATTELQPNSGRSIAGSDSRELTVFVSSTFLDMQPEREVLLKHVGPRLRQLCEQRDLAFGFVDLRWGIAEEESRAGQVVTLCLAEIDRCAPYFVALLGDRYGWVPNEVPVELVAQRPWLSQHRGASLTELEIIDGALRAPVAGCSFFYLRAPSVADPDARLVALKDRIRSSVQTVRDYSRADEFGAQVLTDLTALIDRQYPAAANQDPREREDQAHRAYGKSVTRIHIPRPYLFERLDGHAEGDGPPLVICGESGAGKSALLAEWTRRWREEHPDQLVLVHYVGASADSTQWDQMLLRIIVALKTHFDIDREIPTELDGLKSAFSEFLYRASTRGRCVLVVDGLDKFEDRDNAPDLLWLPDLPLLPSLRVVLSTVEGRSLDAVHARKWPTLRLDPLSRTDRERFVDEYLALYSKRLDSARVDRIADASQTANPSFLQTLLEELRLFGEHEQLDERIDAHLRASDVTELSEQILQRLENDYGAGRPALVPEVMTSLWASRMGLQEVEVLDLLGSGSGPLSQSVWAPLRAGAEASFLVRGGLLGFRQEAFRQAVERRYVSTPEAKQQAHGRLADYFDHRPLSRRKAMELPWQLKQSGQLDRLADLLGDLPFLAESIATRTFDACELWNDLEKNTPRRRVQAYSDVIDHPERHLGSVDDVTLLLLNGDEIEPATRLLDVAERHCEAIGRLDLQADMLWNLYKIRCRSITRMEWRRVVRPGDVLKKQIAVLRKLKASERLVLALSELAGEILDDAGTIPNDEVKRRLIVQARGHHQEAERLARDAGISGEVAIALAKQAVSFIWLGDWHAGVHLHDLAFRRALESHDKKALLFVAWQRANLFGGVVLDGQQFRGLLRVCVDLSRQIDNVRDHAHKLKSVAKTLLTVAAEPADYDEVMEWRGEARRMMQLAGDTDPWLGDTTEAVIRAAANAKVSMPQALGSKPILEGPRRKWWAVSKSWLDKCREQVEASLTDLCRGKDIDSFEMEYYDALDYVLNPIRRVDAGERAAFVAKLRKDAGSPEASRDVEVARSIQALSAVLNGGDMLFPGHAYGYLESDGVKGVAEWSKALFVPEWDALTRAITNRMLDEAGLYPGGWEDWGDDGRSHLRQRFEALSEFFGKAAEQGAAMVVGPSGADLERFVSDWIDRRTAEQQTPTDWFQGRSRDVTDITGACRYCDAEYSYDLCLHERPPPRCPACGR